MVAISFSNFVNGIFDFVNGILDFENGILDFENGILDFGFWILDFLLWVSDFSVLLVLLSRRLGVPFGPFGLNPLVISPGPLGLEFCVESG